MNEVTLLDIATIFFGAIGFDMSFFFLVVAIDALKDREIKLGIITFIVFLLLMLIGLKLIILYLNKFG